MVYAPNISFDEAPTQTTADTARFYYGERDPKLPPDPLADPQFYEEATKPASWILKGTINTTPATITVTATNQ